MCKAKKMQLFVWLIDHIFKQEYIFLNFIIMIPLHAILSFPCRMCLYSPTFDIESEFKYRRVVIDTWHIDYRTEELRACLCHVFHLKNIFPLH